ncbi:MAG: hypothetical protein ABI324_04145 [Ktedonobacteraceae bacterium]
MSHTLPCTIMQIPTTLEGVALCWKLAEKALQDTIRCDLPGADEETITLLFYLQFAEQLRQRSREGLFAKAFLSDLVENFPDLADSPELWKIAEGLVADITLHKRATERITGGDFGLMIIRPQVIRIDNLLRIGDYRRGLLCQAKLKGEKGEWGSFTKRQLKLLPERMSYLSLLLYSYNDAERHHLHDFQWHVCLPNETLDLLEGYLKTDAFPSLHESRTVIGAVGYGRIGTDDDRLLDQFVSPKRNPTLIIKLSWPDGRSTPPGSFVYVYSAQDNYTQQVHIRSQQISQ